MSHPANQQQADAFQYREPDHPIDHLFLQRWSPRAFEASPLPVADLLTILEAARWAPSAFNLQRWRFMSRPSEHTAGHKSSAGEGQS